MGVDLPLHLAQRHSTLVQGADATGSSILARARGLSGLWAGAPEPATAGDDPAETLAALVAAAHVGRPLRLEAGEPSRDASPEPTTDVAGPLRTPAPDAPWVALATSGTTRGGRTLVKTAGQIGAEATYLVEALGLTPDDRVLALVPPRHIFGLLHGLLAPVLAGATLVPAPRGLVGLSSSDALDGSAATVLVAVPSQLDAVVRAAPGLPRLRLVVSSGAPLPVGVARQLARAHGCAVVEFLGSTETGGIARRDGTDDTAPWEPLSVVETRIAGDRLEVRSPFAGAGWVMTAERVVAAPTAAAPGAFRRLGRSDEVVKIAGRRLELSAVEAAARDLHGVRDAKAVVEPAPAPRDAALFLAVEAPPSVTSEGVRQHLAERFDAVLLPRRIVVVETLPRGAAGKVAADALKPLLTRPSRPPPVATPPRPVAAPPPPVPAPSAGPRPLPPGADQISLEVELDQDHPCFEGHFPGHPIFPAVAQLTHLVEAPLRRVWRDLDGPFTLSRAKFKAPLFPGMTVQVKMTRSQGSVSFVIIADDKIRASGVLLFEGGS